MKPFSALNRSEIIEQMKVQEFDLVIIGGGITGAGAFLDAQSRGLNCCLIEMQDFAEGTSSRSTRLIHGGLRYLKQFNFKVVSETGKERNIIQHIARHLTYPKKVLVLSVKNGTYSKFQLGLAIRIYEWLTQVPNKLRHITFSRKELIKKNPIFDKTEVLGGIEYVEFQTTDARLVIENIKTAVNLGGVAVSHIKAIDIVLNESKLKGIMVQNTRTNEQFELKTRSAINACGIWADKLLPSKFGSIFNKISPTKGVHIVLAKEKFPIKTALYFDTTDKRMIFAIPVRDIVYVGTTDTFYHQNLLNPQVKKEDVDYLIKMCNIRFPSFDLTNKDVVSAWAGIRPLIYQKGKAASEISRKHEILVSSFGLITIAGGKLTGYRKMAEQAVDLVVKQFNDKKIKTCTTHELKLIGSNFISETDYIQAKKNFIVKYTSKGWDEKDIKWVFKHFGSETDKVIAFAKNNPNDILPGYLYGALLYCLNYEMIHNVIDFVQRRTDLFYFNQAVCRKFYTEIQAVISAYLRLPKMESEIVLTELENQFNHLVELQGKSS